MQRSALIHSFKARFGPSRRLGIAIFLAALATLGFIFDPADYQGLIEFVLQALAFGYLYAFSPVPWQYTGDGRARAPFMRGLLQSLVWNGTLLALAILLLVKSGGPGVWLSPGDLAELALEGYVTTSEILWVISYRTLAFTCLAGWLIAREEESQAVRKGAEETRRALEYAARQAQVQSLQSQLDPHVLYNALSGISELIREDPTKAEKAIVRLSDLYRRLTALGKRESVRLDEERQLLEDYLAVEQVRLGARLQVTWKWPEALDERRVPPLMIQPLVENAIKHGLSPEEDGGRILISVAAAEGDLLHIIIANTGKPLDPEPREGTGLSNLSDRLALLGGGSSLKLRQEGSMTVADLRVLSRGTP